MGTAGVTPQQDRVNWDEFDKLVAYQCTQQEIADFFGISVDSLDRACQRDRGEKLAEVWDKKKRAGRVKLKKAQFRIAESNHPAAANHGYILRQGTAQPI
jgi:hypothetical protein